MSKRQYKCGQCGDLGHNKRKCPTLGATSAGGTKGDSVSTSETESKPNSLDQSTTAREKKESEKTPKSTKKPKAKKKAKVKKVVARKQPKVVNKAEEPENEPEAPKAEKPTKKTKAKKKPTKKVEKKPEAKAEPKTRGRKKVLTYETKLAAFMLAPQHKKRLEQFAEQLSEIKTKKSPGEKFPKGASAGLRHILDFISDDELRRIAKRSA